MDAGAASVCQTGAHASSITSLFFSNPTVAISRLANKPLPVAVLPATLPPDHFCFTPVASPAVVRFEQRCTHLLSVRTPSSTLQSIISSLSFCLTVIIVIVVQGRTPRNEGGHAVQCSSCPARVLAASAAAAAAAAALLSTKRLAQPLRPLQPLHRRRMLNAVYSSPSSWRSSEKSQRSMTLCGDPVVASHACSGGVQGARLGSGLGGPGRQAGRQGISRGSCLPALALQASPSSLSPPPCGPAPPP